MASGHVNRTYRPNTWLHRPILQNVKKPLANSEPSTHGTFETSRDVRSVVAIGGKSGHDADSPFRQLLTRFGHTGLRGRDGFIWREPFFVL
jgi:hypothetical protein